MTWRVTIKTIHGTEVHENVSDLDALIAGLSDDEPSVVSALPSP